MQTEPTSLRALDEVLSDFECLLADERAALTRLNAERMDECAEGKLQLADELRSLAAELTEAQAERLRSLGKAMRINQVLLVHARDHVRGVIGMLSGESLPSPRRESLPGDAARLSLKG